MNSLLIIENTVLEIQELFPYYTKYYIRESIDFGFDNQDLDDFNNKYLKNNKESLLDILKSKSKKIFKKGKDTVFSLFSKLLKINLYLILAAQIYTAALASLGVVSVNTDPLKEAVDKADYPQIQKQLTIVETQIDELPEEGKNNILFVIKDKKFKGKINKLFQKTFISLGDESLDLGVNVGKIIGLTIQNLQGKNSVASVIKKAKAKLVDDANKLTEENVIKSYIKSVILESKV